MQTDQLNSLSLLDAVVVEAEERFDMTREQKLTRTINTTDSFQAFVFQSLFLLENLQSTLPNVVTMFKKDEYKFEFSNAFINFLDDIEIEELRAKLVRSLKESQETHIISTAQDGTMGLTLQLTVLAHTDRDAYLHVVRLLPKLLLLKQVRADLADRAAEDEGLKLLDLSYKHVIQIGEHVGKLLEKMQNDQTLQAEPRQVAKQVMLLTETTHLFFDTLEDQTLL